MGSILNFDRDINGVVVSARELMKELQDATHQVELVTPYKRNRSRVARMIMEKSGTAFKVSNHTIFFIINLLMKLWIILVSSWRIREEVDVLHAHDPVTALAFRLVAQARHTVLLQTHFNGSPSLEFVSAGYIPKNGISHNMIQSIFSRILRSNRLKLVAVSEHSKYEVQRIAGERKDEPFVLYPGIPSNHGAEKLRHEGISIINVGSIESRKNQLLAIELISELKSVGIAPHLHFVGSMHDAYKQKLQERIAQLDLSDQVHFHGQLSIDETRNLIHRADLYLHTATEESFGRVIVEAISTGTPVLAHEYPAIWEILDDESVLRNGMAISEQAAHLKEILTNTNRLISIKRRQYSNYLMKFTPEIMLRDYTQIIAAQAAARI